jgi:hypothetical protein
VLARVAGGWLVQQHASTHDATDGGGPGRRGCVPSPLALLLCSRLSRSLPAK